MCYYINELLLALQRLSECLYRLELFSELSELRLDIPDGTPLLQTLAERFSSLGMHEEAVDCFIRCNNVKGAIDCCVIQNRLGLFIITVGTIITIITCLVLVSSIAIIIICYLCMDPCLSSNCLLFSHTTCHPTLLYPHQMGHRPSTC